MEGRDISIELETWSLIPAGFKGNGWDKYPMGGLQSEEKKMINRRKEGRRKGENIKTEEEKRVNSKR